MRYPRTIGLSGNTGATENSSRSLYIEFDYASLFPFIVLVAYPGDLIRSAYVEIRETFNAGIDFSLGFPANPEAFLKTSEINPQRQAIFETLLSYLCEYERTITLYVTGTPTQGKGLVNLEIGEKING